MFLTYFHCSYEQLISRPIPDDSYSSIFKIFKFHKKHAKAKSKDAISISIEICTV